MLNDELRRIAAGLPPRRVVVVSDRYPPDIGGGAEVSLHLLLRRPALREQCLVVTFDKALGSPLRRRLDGVEVLALPAAAAWPLHRLSQQQVEALKRRPALLKWTAFMREAVGGFLRAPRLHGPALALRIAGPPDGGVRMDHAVGPEGRAAAALRVVFDAVRPALVHADNAVAILAAAEALRERPTPLVALVRDHRFTSARFDQGEGDAEPGTVGRLAHACAGAALAYRRGALARASVAVATSAHLAATLAEDAVFAEKLRLLPLEPVDLPAPGGPKSGGESFSILIVGSLSDNKGQAHLVEAWPDIARRIPDARLDIVGRGPASGRIEALIDRLGARDRITLHGHLHGEALEALYRDCDLVALPTLWAEPFGRVPIEAGAAGKPVVAYGAGGLAQTVRDRVTGRLVARGDRAAFIDALVELAGDCEMRARLGAAGRAIAAADHDPERLAALLAGLWDEVAGAAAAHPSPSGR